MMSNSVSFRGMTWNDDAMLLNAKSFLRMLLLLHGMIVEWYDDYTKWHVAKLKSNRNIDVCSVEW